MPRGVGVCTLGMAAQVEAYGKCSQPGWALFPQAVWCLCSGCLWCGHSPFVLGEPHLCLDGDAFLEGMRWKWEIGHVRCYVECRSSQASKHAMLQSDRVSTSEFDFLRVCVCV